MRTTHLVLTFTAVLMMSTGVLAAEEVGSGVKPETIKYYQGIKADVTKLSESPSIKKYAAEQSEKATAAIETAQSGLKSLNDQETRQAAEIASLWGKLAQAVTEEKQATERTEASQSQLNQLEQRLADILAGKGEKP